MKTSTKFVIGAAAMVAVSAGVAGVTAYAVMQNNQKMMRLLSMIHLKLRRSRARLLLMRLPCSRWT